MSFLIFFGRNSWRLSMDACLTRQLLHKHIYQMLGQESKSALRILTHSKAVCCSWEGKDENLPSTLPLHKPNCIHGIFLPDQITESLCGSYTSPKDIRTIWRLEMTKSSEKRENKKKKKKERKGKL